MYNRIFIAYNEDDQNVENMDIVQSSLKLDLQVRSEVLNSEERLQSELENLFDKMITRSNGNQIIPSDRPIVSIVEPCEKGITILKLTNFLYLTCFIMRSFTTLFMDVLPPSQDIYRFVFRVYAGAFVTFHRFRSFS